MTKSQVFFWLLISFIAGVAAASFLPLSLPLVAAVFVLGGCTAAFALLAPAARGRLAVFGAAIMVFAFGLFWLFRVEHPAASSLASRIGERLELVGVIHDEPVKSPKTQRLVVRAAGEKILITARPYPEYRYGDRIAVAGRLERPESFSDDFDYAASLAKDDIFYTMAFPEIFVLGAGGGNPVYQNLFRLKAAFSRTITRHLPEPEASLMLGLTIGERQNFPAELTAALRTTGTTHIVALSGYNITIVADAMLKTFMFLALPFAWAFWFAVSGIIGFTLLTGAAASVVRAALMGILVLVARREGRAYRMRNALAFAGAAMLVVNPKLLRFDVAFQLSFLATLGLVYGAPVVERGYERMKLRLIPPSREAGIIREEREFLRARRKKRSLLRGVFISTLAAQLAVLPLIVYRFGTLSLISPLANLAILPLVPTTMFFGFLTGGAAMAADVLGRIPAAAGWVLLHYELGAIGFFSRLPLASTKLSGFGVVLLLGVYAAVGIRLWRSYGRNPKRKNITQ